MSTIKLVFRDISDCAHKYEAVPGRVWDMILELPKNPNPTQICLDAKPPPFVL